jgi:DNA polymerase-3 subunit delta'
MVIFDPADNFAAPTAHTAANRLLKTLEEPIARTHFVLITSSAQVLLSTIRSRTQRLRFLPLPDEVIAGRLQAELEGGQQELIDQVVKLAQGSLGRALQQIKDAEGLLQREQAAQDLLRAARSGQAQRIVELAAEVGKDRDEAQEVLSLLWLHLHGALRERVRAGRVGPLLRHLRATSEAGLAIRRYTSPPLALEWMMRHLGAAERTS